MMKSKFDLLGVNTAQISILTMKFVATVEPENLKCVLSSDFRSYSLGDKRKALMRPVLGEGIFTTDGKEWVLFFFSSSFFSCLQQFISLLVWSLKRRIRKRRVYLLRSLTCSLNLSVFRNL